MGLGVGMMIGYLKMLAGVDSRNGGVVHCTAREGNVGGGIGLVPGGMFVKGTW